MAGSPPAKGLDLLFEHDLRANAFRVCREGKPVPTFPDHALVYFAWGCFRDFVSRPGGSPPKPRPGHTRSLARRRSSSDDGQVALPTLAILSLLFRRQRRG